MRRRRLARLLWRLNMWSATGGGGGNSGTRRRSSSAGGSLRLMALSSATPSGALRRTFLNVPVIMLDKFQQSWFLLWSCSPCRLCSGLGSFPRQSDGHSSWVPRWRCTVHTVRRTVEFHWSSFLVWCRAPVVVQQQVLWPTLLAYAGSTVDTCSASLLGVLWKIFTYFFREDGYQILKLILHPALLVKWRSMHSICFDC